MTWAPRLERLLSVQTELARICAQMHDTGIYVNQQWRAFSIHCAEQSILEKAEKLSALVSHPQWRPTPNRLRSLIYRRHATKELSRFNLPDPPDKRMYTDDTLDNISVDESSLLLLMVGGECPPELVPIIEAWWEYQGEVKRRSALATADIDEATGPDGRMRPGWNSCGTDTGRFSCSSPSVMNLEQSLRCIYGPPPGRVWIHADKSQLELRVMACVAEDDVLQRALDSQDVYSYDARLMFQLGADADVKKTHPGLRKAAKIIHLGRQYGAGLKAIYAQALRQDRRFTMDRVRQFTGAWDKLYYRTVRYWEEEMSRVMECGYSESRVMQRRRHYPRPPDRSEVANYPVQATAADLMNGEIIKLWHRLADEVPNARIVTQLHDAIDVECSEADAARTERIMKEVMNNEYTINGRTAPFFCEFKTATSDDTWAAV